MNDLELVKRVFHQSAIQSYLAARLMLCTNFLSPIGLYSAHLACECMLKSLTAQFGKEPLKKHDLIILLGELKSVSKAPTIRQIEIKDVFEWLNPYQELGRYGAMAQQQFDPSRIDTAELKVFGNIQIQPNNDLARIDYTIANLYQLTDVDYDIIRQINTTGILPRWNYPISVSEVLYSENAYFTSNC